MQKRLAVYFSIFWIILNTTGFSQVLFTKDFDPSKTLDLPLPPGRQICFAAIGRWEPDMKGAAGIDVSSFGYKGIKHLSLLKGEYDLGKNYPGKPFVCKTANFFAIVWRIDDNKEYETISGIGNAIANTSNTPQMIHFKMNDEVDEFYNNSGWLRFIYFYQDVNASMAWSVSPESTFKLDSYRKKIMQPSNIPGLNYEWVLDHYNYDSKKYDYTAYFHNTTGKDIKFEATYICNKGTVQKLYHFLTPGEYMYYPGISAIGMSLSISVKEVSAQTVIPAKQKYIQQYNKLLGEASQLQGTDRLDKLYELKALTDNHLPEKSKEVDDMIAAQLIVIKDGPLYGFAMNAEEVERPIENCPPCPVGYKTHIKVMEEGGVVFGRECECIVDNDPNRTNDPSFIHVPPLSDIEFGKMLANYQSAIDKYCVVLRKMARTMNNSSGTEINMEEFISAMQNFQDSFMAFANKTMKKAQFEQLSGSIKKLEPCINETIQGLNSMNIGGQTLNLPPIQLPDISILGINAE